MQWGTDYKNSGLDSEFLVNLSSWTEVAGKTKMLAENLEFFFCGQG